jgi:hypothetical protein
MHAETSATKARTAQPAGAKTDQATEAAASAETNPAAAPRVIPPISPEKASLKHFRHNAWSMILDPGVGPDDLDSPTLCNNVCRDLTRFDDVRLIAADGGFMAEAIVADVWFSGARLKVLRVVDIPKESELREQKMPEGYEIRRANVGDGQPGWLVVRTADGVVLNAGNFIYSAEDARHYLVKHPAVTGPAANSIWRG